MMLTAHPLYSSPDDTAFTVIARDGGVQQVMAIYEEKYGIKVVDPLAKDLIHRMLHIDPTKRPTLEEVLTHPFCWMGWLPRTSFFSIATGNNCRSEAIAINAQAHVQ